MLSSLIPGSMVESDDNETEGVDSMMAALCSQVDMAAIVEAFGRGGSGASVTLALVVLDGDGEEVHTERAVVREEDLE